MFYESELSTTLNFSQYTNDDFNLIFFNNIKYYVTVVKTPPLELLFKQRIFFKSNLMASYFCKKIISIIYLILATLLN